MSTAPVAQTANGVPGTATALGKDAAALPGYKHPLDPLTPEEASASCCIPACYGFLNMSRHVDCRHLARTEAAYGREDGYQGYSLHHDVPAAPAEARRARIPRHPARDEQAA